MFVFYFSSVVGAGPFVASQYAGSTVADPCENKQKSTSSTTKPLVLKARQEMESLVEHKFIPLGTSLCSSRSVYPRTLENYDGQGVHQHTSRPSKVDIHIC